MDFHLKQWKNQHESEQQHYTKMPKFLQESHQQPQSSASSLSLFVPEQNSKVSSTLSVLSDSTLATTTFPRMGSYFSFAQWQELELQTLIFRYILAGAAVPPELLQPIKKSLLHSHPYFLNHPIQHYLPSLLQSGYWGRAAMDPEPGRCRRTDGKKWRCSREVVAGQKYCERHMHRGRNRSRKHVELPVPTSVTGVDAGNGSLGSTSTSSISLPSLANASFKCPFDLLHFNESSSGTKNDNNSMFETQDHVDGDGRSDGHILRHFFNDWPPSVQKPEHSESNAGMMNSATCLSISMPGNTRSSDVLLKLSTGNDNEVASMGGPLGEALTSTKTSLTCECSTSVAS